MKDRTVKIFIKKILVIGILAVFLASCSNSPNPDEIKESFFGSGGDDFKIEDEFGSLLKQETGFVKVSENHGYELYVNPRTAEIYVYDKINEEKWYSNPPDKDIDEVVSDPAKERLYTQFIVRYITARGSTGSHNSYTDCVMDNRQTYKKIDNGIRITYLMGEEPKVYLAPLIISKERMEEKVLPQLDEIDQVLIRTFYTLLSLDEIENELDRATMLGRFPSLARNDIYILGRSAADQASISEYMLGQVQEIFEKTDYTLEDMDSDHEENDYEVVERANYQVRISADFTLDDNGLKVNIPNKGIVFDEKVMYFSRLQVLPYFGAAHSGEEGYIFIPEGSGGIIRFSTSKTRFEQYNKKYYGQDFAFPLERLEGDEQFMLHFPVYGMKTDDKAFLAVIEEGDACAYLRASVAGVTTDFYTVWPEFEFTVAAPTQFVLIGANVFSYQREPLESDITVRYLFSYDEKANYAGMAGAYREFLLENEKLKQHMQEEVSLNIGLVGGVKYKDSFFGFPVDSVKPLTSFENAVEILDELTSHVLGGINLTYFYWANGADENYVPRRVNPLNELGGVSGFNDLIRFAENKNINIYPDLDFVYPYSGKYFRRRSENARQPSDMQAYKYDYKVSTFMRDEDNRRYIVSPRALGDIVDNFLKSYERFDIQSLSINTLGNSLNSDYRHSGVIDRQEAKDIAVENMLRMKNSGLDLNVHSANAYALGSARLLTSAPASRFGNYLFDETVPFYQILLSGIMEYTSEPLNMASDYEYLILKCIETGMSPYFKWIYEESYELKDTEYDLFAAHYRDWVEKAVEAYEEISRVHDPLVSLQITGHEALSSDVYKTVYENGTVIVVNYTLEDYVYRGRVIEGKGYEVINNDQ